MGKFYFMTLVQMMNVLVAIFTVAVCFMCPVKGLSTAHRPVGRLRMVSKRHSLAFYR
jgi:hypothetical protein